jgi:hypothetical protein
MKLIKRILLPPIKVVLILLFIFFNPLVRLFMKFDYIFFTYAGGKKDVRGYGPVFISRLLPSIIPVGYMRKKEGIGRGIVLGTARSARDFYNPESVFTALAVLARWRKKTGAVALALGGQLPSIMEKNGVGLRPPYVKSIYGTVFILHAIVSRLIEDNRLVPEKLTVGIIGIGFIGSALTKYFSGLYKTVIAVDNRLDPGSSWPRNVTYTDDHSKLRTCDIVILLTGRGDDAAAAFRHFKKNVIVIDDAHPQLSRDYIEKIRLEKQGSVNKAVVGLEGIRYIPKLPGFKADWIPGCAVEVIVATKFGFTYQSQDEFNSLAVKAGFFPVVEPHFFD